MLTRQTNEGASLTNIPSLDGLRAAAAAMVVFFHCPIVPFQLRFGWVGVNLFFILSGFLITRMLMALQETPFKTALQHFYLRRVRRIFPLYFFYILVVFLLLSILTGKGAGQDIMMLQGLSDAKRNAPFLASFTYNFEGAVNFLLGRPYTNSMFFGHLWTLSVEVQFYCIFPFIFRLLSRQALKRALVLVILLVPFLRLFAVLLLKQKVNDLLWIGELLYEATPFQLDALSVGILIALIDVTAILRYIKALFVGVVIVTILVGGLDLYYLQWYHVVVDPHSFGFDNPVYHLINPLPNIWLNNRYFYTIPLINVLFGLAFMLVKNGMLFKYLFESRVLVWIGKISYGVYIYHLGFSYVFERGVAWFFGKELSNFNFSLQVALLIIYISLLLSIAAVSYYSFERKCTRLPK